MRVQRVSYGFTKNLGNFQSERVDATIELAEGDDPDMALDAAAAFVREALGEKPGPADIAVLNRLRSSVAMSRNS